MPDGIDYIIVGKMKITIVSHDVFSPIRTLTVGSGFSPDLLTSRVARERSRASRSNPGHRRWGLSPRPENYDCSPR